MNHKKQIRSFEDLVVEFFAKVVYGDDQAATL